MTTWKADLDSYYGHQVCKQITTTQAIESVRFLSLTHRGDKGTATEVKQTLAIPSHSDRNTHPPRVCQDPPVLQRGLTGRRSSCLDRAGKAGRNVNTKEGRWPPAIIRGKCEEESPQPHILLEQAGIGRKALWDRLPGCFIWSLSALLKLALSGPPLFLELRGGVISV